jgi:hypothetical protein
MPAGPSAREPYRRLLFGALFGLVFVPTVIAEAKGLAPAAP